MLIVSRDLFKIIADGGRIGSPAAVARASQQGRRVVGEAQDHEDFEGIDVAVVGEADPDVRRTPDAKRPGS